MHQGGVSHAAVFLFRTGTARFERLFDLEAYIARHKKYSTWGAQVRYRYLTTGRCGEETITPRLFGNSQERRRLIKALIIRLPFERWLWFACHLIVRPGFLEGRAGLIASQIRARYIAQTRAKIFELQPQCLPKSKDDSKEFCGCGAGGAWLRPCCGCSHEPARLTGGHRRAHDAATRG